MNNKLKPKEKAKKDLRECFCRCWPGGGELWTQKSIDFINSITDNIIEAAVDEVKVQFKEALSAPGVLGGMFGGGSGAAIVEKFVETKRPR